MLGGTGRTGSLTAQKRMERGQNASRHGANDAEMVQDWWSD